MRYSVWIVSPLQLICSSVVYAEQNGSEDHVQSESHGSEFQEPFGCHLFFYAHQINLLCDQLGQHEGGETEQDVSHGQRRGEEQKRGRAEGHGCRNEGIDHLVLDSSLLFLGHCSLVSAGSKAVMYAA